MLKSSISSLMSWKFFNPSCVANSLTMIGGLMVMTFFASSSTGGAISALAWPSVDPTAGGSAAGAGGSGGSSAGPGGGAVNPGFATNLEIGGKIVVRTFGVPSVALALGLSINETVSILPGFGFCSVFSAVERRTSAGSVFFSFTEDGAPCAGFSAGFAFNSLALAGGTF